MKTIAFSPDCRQVASGHKDNVIRLWDVETGNLVELLGKPVIYSTAGYGFRPIYSKSYYINEGHFDTVMSIAYTPDGKYLVSGSADKSIRIWDLKTHNTIQVIKAYKGILKFVSSIVISPNGKYILSFSIRSRTIKIWAMPSLDLVKTIKLEKGKDMIYSQAFSPDGKYIFVGYGKSKTIKMFELSTGELVRTIVAAKKSMTPRGSIRTLAISLDGRFIACGFHTKNKIKVWKLSTGELFRTMEGHNKTVCKIVFSPNGKHIISASYDRTIKVWDAETGNLIQTLLGHGTMITSLAISPDGKYLASSDNGGFFKSVKMKFWELRDEPLTENVA